MASSWINTVHIHTDFVKKEILRPRQALVASRQACGLKTYFNSPLYFLVPIHKTSLLLIYNKQMALER